MYSPDPSSSDDIISSNMTYTESEAAIQQSHSTGLLGMLKREATALQSYYFLRVQEHHEREGDEIMPMIHKKQQRIQQLTNMYISITGLQPIYDYDQIVFQNYYDGLKQIQEFELTTLEYYRYYCSYSEHPRIREMYYHFLQEK